MVKIIQYVKVGEHWQSDMCIVELSEIDTAYKIAQLFNNASSSDIQWFVIPQ